MIDACLDVRVYEIVVLASVSTVGLIMHSVGVRSYDVIDTCADCGRGALRPLLLKMRTQEALDAVRVDLDRRKVQILSA